MSQRDLVAELRAARVSAPAELRNRVRAIAAADTPPRRWFTWRRVLVVAVPAAAGIAAAIVFTRPITQEQTVVRHGAAATIGKAPERAARQKALGALGSDDPCSRGGRAGRGPAP